MLSAQSSQVSDDKLYVDDVFSAYTYIGNGSTQTINNGIDLAGKGGMVWVKNRTVAQVGSINDTARGALNDLIPSLTNAASPAGVGLNSFNSNGFSISSPTTVFNSNLDKFISWTFRKAPKFFDVVTYTGNGAAGRQIPHNLGIAPGMVIVKCTNYSGSWFVYHKNSTGTLKIESTDALSGSRPGINSTSADTFVVSDDISYRANADGYVYVAYLFAHDTSTDGLIQCGSFTTTGADLDVNLGWETQYVNFKASSAAGSWTLIDTSRGFALDPSNTTSPAARLLAENSSQELFANVATPTATGFKIRGGALVSGVTYIYMAIRRPNKPPTTGTQVYNAIARTGNGTTETNVNGVGFPPDFCHTFQRSGGNYNVVFDRLRGTSIGALSTDSLGAESLLAATVTAFLQDGVTVSRPVSGSGIGSTNTLGQAYINHFFKRAHGVFDIVCYTGTGVAKTEAHNLGVVPELVIVKERNNLRNWIVGSKDIGANDALFLNQNSATYPGYGTWNNTRPASVVFSLSGANNFAASTYVAYLFATKAGISKVGNYTGNGSTQVINCGFTTGARFALIKRTDNLGDWFVWDTARGIVAGTDPHLSLNTTAAEVTSDDSIDPDTSGFIVNQVAATDINVTGASYIFLSFA